MTVAIIAAMCFSAHFNGRCICKERVFQRAASGDLDLRKNSIFAACNVDLEGREITRGLQIYVHS